MQRALAEVVVRAGDRIVVNAELLRPTGRACQRTDVIPSGVDTDRFRPSADRIAAKARLGVDVGRPLIGTVGRLEPRKGTATLIAALATLRAGGRDASLVVVGDGPLRSELVATAARLGLASHVQMLGDRADIEEILAAVDVFVLPSRTEGMSNALLEAMAMALPVVATAVGGTPEVIAEGRSGLLVPSDDPSAMAAATRDSWTIVHRRRDSVPRRGNGRGDLALEVWCGDRSRVCRGRQLKTVRSEVARRW